MTPRSPFSCVLWDVDGTVVDASEGILRRLTLCLSDLGYPPPTREELVHWIGPPMHESFQTNVGMTPEQAADATAHYRRIGKADGYTTGARLYPGIAELISELRDAGIPQSTASSKPELQVTALMEHFGLTSKLQSITGATPDEKTLASKADIIGESLRRLEVLGHDTSRPVLVGDRHHDIDGAAVHGVPVIFVRWGFSWPHESEGAQAVVDTVDQLRSLLLLPEEA
ncbi:HAD hydrolase-like protein [Microbacterium invictum]|uniref:Phosphoglycolate phosphatase n=1 Tax=Microbacterium invictum TaxID=515415 RepID=A0AA40SQW4_9MICO|nr:MULTISPECIES: HAD hydrolase-like protein [Microbacterium]MBB4140580.1 phosphoglycolate phosphatase [Microbacterium invictum]